MGGGGSFSIPREARAESITLSRGVFKEMGPEDGVWKAPPGIALLNSLISPEKDVGYYFKIRVPLAEARKTWV
jgi:hypothetical protein